MLYKERIKRKQRQRDFFNNINLNIQLSWLIIKNKLTPTPLFNQVIIKDIHTALESGQKEIRYYQYSGNPLWESLEDSYKFYCEKYNKDLEYNSKVFLDVYKLILMEFMEYRKQVETDKNSDLIIDYYFGKSDLENYFYIKLED